MTNGVAGNLTHTAFTDIRAILTAFAETYRIEGTVTKIGVDSHTARPVVPEAELLSHNHPNGAVANVLALTELVRVLAIVAENQQREINSLRESLSKRERASK